LPSIFISGDYRSKPVDPILQRFDVEMQFTGNNTFLLDFK